jgi:hypothetical protein
MWLRLALAGAVLAVAAGAPGCGGSDPLAPAHSASFYPVRGTADNGGPAARLHWVQRINGGQPIASTSVLGSAVQFGDSDVTAQDDIITSVIDGSLLNNGVSIGHESIRSDQHLVPGSSPATVGEQDTNLTVSVSEGGMQVSEHDMLKYSYTPPLPTFFDRDDLDSTPVGTTGSADSEAVVTGTTTVTVTGQGTQTQTVSQTVPSSATWTLMDMLATFNVLGHDYADVVVAQVVSSATASTGGPSVQITSKLWLAKGSETIRSEQTGDSLAVEGPLTAELVTTNLVP